MDKNKILEVGNRPEELNPKSTVGTSRRKAIYTAKPLKGSGIEGSGPLLQYSCLENPMDGGAWWAAVRGVAESQT